jgi:hypothetical protein
MSTRGASVQTRISFQRTSLKRARTHTPKPRDPLEVIVVSDSDDVGPVLAGRKKTVRQREKAKAVPRALVYDITSDEGDGDDGATPKPDSTTLSVLRAKVHALESVRIGVFLLVGLSIAYGLDLGQRQTSSRGVRNRQREFSVQG